MNTRFYAAIHEQESVRKLSSSGGVFYELMKYVLDNNGVIFGASFDSDWNVIHAHSESMDGCKAFLGSKYVQSKIGDEYMIAREYLDCNRMVLFSGTPCQIAGLKSFLGREYENLITVDFICHGVPSPAVWQRYLQHISSGKSIIGIRFRDKTEGWTRFSLKIDFCDGSTYRRSQFEDIYIKGFLQDIYLRPSCYECRFKGVDRISDITIADYWGIQNDNPTMFDDRGTSLVLLQSEKGKDAWNTIKHNFKWNVTDEKALQYNVNALKSVKRPDERELFYHSNMDFKKLERMTNKSHEKKMIQKVRGKIKKLVKK